MARERFREYWHVGRKEEKGVCERGREEED